MARPLSFEPPFCCNNLALAFFEWERVRQHVMMRTRSRRKATLPITLAIIMVLAVLLAEAVEDETGWALDVEVAVALVVGVAIAVAMEEVVTVLNPPPCWFPNPPCAPPIFPLPPLLPPRLFILIGRYVSNPSKENQCSAVWRSLLRFQLKSNRIDSRIVKRLQSESLEYPIEMFKNYFILKQSINS